MIEEDLRYDRYVASRTYLYLLLVFFSLDSTAPGTGLTAAGSDHRLDCRLLQGREDRAQGFGQDLVPTGGERELVNSSESA